MGIKKDVRILCVDDYENVRLLLVKNLKENGFTGEIVTAVDGKDAFDKMLQHYQDDQAFDLVISDFVMPEMTGLELLKQIRSNFLFENLPVLMLTSEADKDTVMDCLSAGASNYLLKPWKVDDLLSKIDTCWKKHHK